MYAKQGRAQQFTTQAARDKYLNEEIKSLKAYEKAQQKRVDDLRKEVDGARTQLAEVVTRTQQANDEDEQRRDDLKSKSEEMASLRGKVDGMQEQRK